MFRFAGFKVFSLESLQFVLRPIDLGVVLGHVELGNLNSVAGASVGQVESNYC